MSLLAEARPQSTGSIDWSRLDRPVPLLTRVAGIVVASALFFAIMGLLGGPIEGDASESVYATWAISHADLACSYPPLGHHHINGLAIPFAAAAPMYPLVSGVVAAALRIGHTVAFPTRGELGAGCQAAVIKLFNWSTHASSILTTIRLGYLVWPLLLWGALYLVRSTRQRRTWWEPVTALSLAFCAPVWLCLVEFFHPQDVMAMAFILLAAGAALRQRWTWSGVAIGLAVASQQFALLALIPLLVVAPAGRRRNFFSGAVLSSVIVDLPFVVATSGRALRAIAVGSSRAGNHNPSYGGSVLWEAHLHGPALFIVARLMPLAAAGLVAWWAKGRWGDSVRDPVPLAALLGVALAMRLVFEQNLFGYYFMALGVALVVVDALTGRIRGTTWAWVGLVTLAFNPVNPGFYSNWTTWGPHLYRLTPIVVLLAGVAAAVVEALRRRFPIYLYAWLLVALLTSESRLWGANQTVVSMPHWAWQLILVPTAILLLARPLLVGEGRADEPGDWVTVASPSA